MREWHYSEGEEKKGPISEEKLQELLPSFPEGYLIWTEGLDSWKPSSKFEELVESLQSKAQLPKVPQEPMYTHHTNGFAITSLVLGIMSILGGAMYLGIFTGIPGVIFGHLSINQINKSPEPQSGKGMAIAGLIMSYLGILFTLCIIAFVIFMFSFAAKAGGVSP